LRARTVLLGSLAALACAAAPANAQYADPAPPWPQLLPPAPTTDQTQPGPAPGCERPSMECVERVIRRLRAYRDRFGCDHRGVFATTYMLLTEAIRDTLREQPDFYDDRDWLFLQDALFADYYFRVIEANEAGQPVPEAWRIAFDTAASGDANAGQDMLLGINAHVQRDMPFVLAEVGLRTRDGTTRKPDHDRTNQVLARAYEPIVREVERRYDPALATTNPGGNPGDDQAGLNVVAEWREQVWRNAERLLEARTAQERAVVVQQIEDNAAMWARSIAGGPQQPGYRRVRDEHCRAFLAANPPAGGAQGARRARLTAYRRCVRIRARASVTGDGVRRVAFFVDGRRVKVDRRADRRGRFRMSVAARRIGPGRHRVTARVTFADGTKGTLRRTIRVCR
jgi:hypothetical protein